MCRGSHGCSTGGRQIIFFSLSLRQGFCRPFVGGGRQLEPLLSFVMLLCLVVLLMLCLVVLFVSLLLCLVVSMLLCLVVLFDCHCCV